MAAIMERHVVEHDAAALDVDRLRIRRIGNADRLAMDRDQLLHVVDRALQIVDVHADVAQIGMDDVVAGQHIGDVARRGAARDPQQDRAADHRRAKAQQHRELRRRGVVVAQPGPPHARAPSADDAGQPRVLARFRAEGFHHRVAGQGVRQRAADLGVPGIGDARGRRDVVHRERQRHRHIDHRADRDHRAEHRPVQPEQDHRAQQHQQRRRQRHQDGVVEQVERPHAARDLAHGRAGKAVGVPVGREALHAHEGVARHVGHDLQRERHDRLQAGQPQDHRHQAQRHDAAEGDERGMPRRRIRRRPSVSASTRRPEKIGMNRSAAVAPEQAAGDDGGAAGLLQPVAEHERDHHAYRRGTFVCLSGHGVIRLRSCAHAGSI